MDRISKVVSRVAAFYGISLDDIKKKSNAHHIVRPRMIASYICYELGERAFYIALVLNCTTGVIYNGVKVMRNELSYDKGLQRDVFTIMNSIDTPALPAKFVQDNAKLAQVDHLKSLFDKHLDKKLILKSNTDARNITRHAFVSGEIYTSKALINILEKEYDRLQIGLFKDGN